MLNKKYIAFCMLVAFISADSAFGAANYNYQNSVPQTYLQNYAQQPIYYNNNEPLKGSVITVPAGESISAVLTTELSSATANTGDSVNLVLTGDYVYNNKTIAPAGSTIKGTVIEASSAKHGSMNGKLCVRFTQITTPAGNAIPISAVIKTNDSTGILVGGTKMDVTKEYTKDLAVGSAAGALSGLVFGALAGGDKLGRGVALGTAVGAGGGLIKSAIDKGNDVEIPANASIELMLTQPITASASNYSFEN